MKEAVLFAPGDMRIVEVDKPTPGPGEVLVQIKAVGICASDIHWLLDGRIGETIMTKPLILGHEFAGIIAEVGAGVTNVKPGDRVAVEPAVPCFKCDMCAEGEINICRNIKFCGTPPTDGALREYMVWQARLVEHIPDSVSLEEAAMLEPLAVGVYAVELAEPLQGKSVGVLGAGAIGLSILQAAKVAGCGRTLVTDLISERLALAKKLGADVTFDAHDAELGSSVKELTGGRGLDVVFEASGENDAMQQAIEMVRPGGVVVIGGIPYDDRINISASIARRKALNIRLLRRSKDTLKRSIDLLRDKKVDVASYVTHKYPLDQVVEAFETARTRKDGALRVVVEI